MKNHTEVLIFQNVLKCSAEMGIRMNKNLELLEDVYESLAAEKKELQTLVNQNLFKIEEISSYLKDLLQKEDDDYKVFSPRNLESIHKEQIEKNNAEKSSYEAENVEYYKKLNKLGNILEKLDTLRLYLKDEEEKQSCDVPVEKENSDDDNKDVPVNYQSSDVDISHIGHRILNCVSYITMDQNRAKTELTALGKSLIK